jgi:hypothetical protein
MVSNLPPNL